MAGIVSSSAIASTACSCVASSRDNAIRIRMSILEQEHKYDGMHDSP